MIHIPTGSFMMGTVDGDADEKPLHLVRVASFELDLTEVTVKAYRACVNAGDCIARSTSSAGEKWILACNYDKTDRDSHPMNCVDWSDAEKFCRWAGKRLPTEEEWEYAARGTSYRKYPWGNEPPTARRLNACGTECANWLEANHGSSRGTLYSSSDRWPTTAPVGSFPAGASPFGVHDMAGNVWEWTASRYCSYGTRCLDGRYVLRGGSWSFSLASSVRAAFRGWEAPSTRNDNLGFRCAK